MLSVLITLWMLLLKLTHDRIPQVILAGDFLYNKEPKLIFPVFSSGKCTACHIFHDSHLKHTSPCDTSTNE